MRRTTELDIGSGRHGRFAIAAALERPRSRIIGIDINEHSFATAEAERRRMDVGNVEFVHGEVHSWLRDHVPGGVFDAFHLYFPTPYVGPIREHNALGSDVSGQLFTPDFVTELLRTAAPGAVLRLVTDSVTYFERAGRVATDRGLTEIEWTSPLSTAPMDQLVGTGCEREMRRLRRPISRVQYLLV